MEGRNRRAQTIQIKKNLDEIVAKGGEINRQTIIDAENISYKKVPTQSLYYDSFGFLDKYKDPNHIKKYIFINNIIFNLFIEKKI